jgi:hypothetical protein
VGQISTPKVHQNQKGENDASLLRLVTAILMDISEDWETGKAYLKPEENGQTPGRKLQKKVA